MDSLLQTGAYEFRNCFGKPGMIYILYSCEKSAKQIVTLLTTGDHRFGKGQNTPMLLPRYNILLLLLLYS